MICSLTDRLGMLIWGGCTKGLNFRLSNKTDGLQTFKGASLCLVYFAAAAVK